MGTQEEDNELRRQLALVRAVVDKVPAMLAYWDSDQRCRFANAAYERWFGVKPETLIGKTMQELLGPIYVRNLPYIEGALRGEEQSFEREIPDPAGGPSRHSQAHYVPDLSGGRVHGFFVMVSDVTELKRVQGEFVAAQRWAAVGTLAAGVAHEINTPVQFVSDNIHFLRNAARRLFAFTETLRTLPRSILDGAPESRLREAAEAILEAEKASRWSYMEQEFPKALDACIEGLDRVAAMVQSLKEFSHPAGTAMEATDLNQIIERTLAISVNEYKYVAQLEMDLGELPPVVCNASEISQVVLNLIVNAAHSIAERVQDSDRKGILRVSTRREGSQAIIAISDTGMGIPEPIRSRIFDPFFTTKSVGKGTGQGLAIAWQLVTHKHQGVLGFESKLGEGSTFFVHLPLEGEDAAGAQRV